MLFSTWNSHNIIVFHDYLLLCLQPCIMICGEPVAVSVKLDSVAIGYCKHKYQPSKWAVREWHYGLCNMQHCISPGCLQPPTKSPGVALQVNHILSGAAQFKTGSILQNLNESNLFTKCYISSNILILRPLLLFGLYPFKPVCFILSIFDAKNEASSKIM